MTEILGYRKAIMKSAQAIGRIEGLDAFNVSALLAWEYGKDKRQVLDDVVKERAAMIGKKHKLRKLM